MYTIENYLTIKKNEIMSFTGKWIKVEIMMLNGLSHTLKDKYHVFAHLCNLDLQRFMRHEFKRRTVRGGST
jgi:hypothetical protein